MFLPLLVLKFMEQGNQKRKDYGVFKIHWPVGHGAFFLFSRKTPGAVSVQFSVCPACSLKVQTCQSF